MFTSIWKQKTPLHEAPRQPSTSVTSRASQSTMKSQRIRNYRYYREEASPTHSDCTPLLPRSDHTDTGSRSWPCLSRIGTVVSIFFFLLGCVKLLLTIPSFMPVPIVEPSPVEPSPFEIAIIGIHLAASTCTCTC